jgi:periplasmic protein TonB
MKTARFVATSIGLSLGWSAAVQAAEQDAAIERALDRGKGKIYAVYARALRENPQLKGRVKLEFTVGPSGKASHCRVVSSQLGAPQVDAQICDSIESLAFEPRAASITVTRTVEFPPAA